MTTARNQRYFSAGPSDKPDDGYAEELVKAKQVFIKQGGQIEQCADGASGYVNKMSSKRNAVIAKKKKGDDE